MAENNFDFHFIGLGGVGQSALAKILLQLGFKVSGSDLEESKYTNQLVNLGAKIFIGQQSENNIQGNPKIVISSAIKENNPELIQARKMNLEILHRSDCLKLISQKFPKFIGLAGTHGKTTTSGLLSFVLEKMDKNPSYAVGGIIPKLNINANANENSEFFVAELDESDGTIKKYAPNLLVVNNLEADHLDFYKNGLDDIISTFEELTKNLSDEAKIFINVDDEGNKKFLNQTKFKNFITFALKNDAFYRVNNVVFNELNSSFDVYRKDKFLGKINLIIPGIHNVYNALAIICVLDNLGFDFNEYSKYFSEFSGMGRRFQLVADVKNIKIIDDYAHHPHEIQSTLEAVKNIKKRKVVIFQPHRYTRLKGLWDEFLDSFNTIDELFVLDVFCAGDSKDETYNSKTFTQEIVKRGISAKYVEGSVEAAGEKIASFLKENDIVLSLGAGDITKIGGVINDLLSK